MEVNRGTSAAGNDQVNFQQGSYSTIRKQFLPFVQNDLKDIPSAPVDNVKDFYTSGSIQGLNLGSNAPPTNPTAPSPFVAESASDPSGFSAKQSVGQFGYKWQLDPSSNLDDKLLPKPGVSSQAIRTLDLAETSQLIRFEFQNGIVGASFGKPSFTITITNNGYASDELIVSESRGPDGRMSLSYANKLGQLIAVNANASGTIPVWSYYVYDIFGQVRIVLPPNAISDITTQSITNFDWSTQSVLTKYATAYEYDDRGNNTWTWRPGGAFLRTYYDYYNRPILSQNALMATENLANVVRYDKSGRVLYKGILKRDNGIQGTLRDFSSSDLNKWLENNLHEKELFYSDIQPDGIKYSQTFPDKYILSELSEIRYYTDYDIDNNGTADYELDLDHQSSFQLYSPVKEDLDFGTCTVEKYLVRTGTGDKYTTLVSFWDQDGRVCQKQIISYNLNKQIITYLYDYTGQVLKIHKAFKRGTALGVDAAQVLAFEYDHAGRALSVTQESPGEPTILASYSYNELGQVHKTVLGGVQDLRYEYDLQGKLLSINNVDELKSDFFAERYYYDEEDQSPSLQRGLQVPTISGAVSRTVWNTYSSTSKRSYNYLYTDGRLTDGNYLYDEGFGWTVGDAKENYSVKGVEYDLNGNITRFRRFGQISQGSFDEIDNLSYLYDGNRLSNVEDNASFQGFETKDFKPIPGAQSNSYDRNGNLIACPSKGINSIQYDITNNLVTEISLDNGNKIKFLRDVLGKVIETQYLLPNDFVESKIDYSGGMTCTTSDYPYKVNQVYVEHPVGRSVYDVRKSNWINEFHIRDLQGSLRIAFRLGAKKDDDEPIGDPQDPTVEKAMAKHEDLATMEESFKTDENQDFDNLDQTRKQDALLAVSGTYVANLTAALGKVIGPLKKIEVAVGDSLDIDVLTYYKKTGSNFWYSLLGLLGGGISIQNIPGLENNPALQSDPLLRIGILATPGLIAGLVSSSQPKAYLKYLHFNKDSVLIASAIVPVTDTGNGHWETLAIQKKIHEGGTVYIYLANESGDNVYADNFRVAQYTPTVVQEQHYYPWGLDISPLEKNVGDEQFPFFFNSKEKLTAFDLEYLDYGARIYDLQLSRWSNDDPAYQFASPYDFCGGDPVNRIDPDGKFAFLPILAVAASAFLIDVSVQASYNGWDFKRVNYLQSGITGVVAGASFAMSIGAALPLKAGLRLAGEKIAKIALNAWADRIFSYNYIIPVGEGGLNLRFGLGSANASYTHGETTFGIGYGSGAFSGGVTVSSRGGKYGLNFSRWLEKDQQTTYGATVGGEDIQFRFDEDWIIGSRTVKGNKFGSHDHWRTGAVSLSYRDYSVGLHLYTGNNPKENKKGITHDTWFGPQKDVNGDVKESNWYLGYDRNGTNYRFGRDNINVQDKFQNSFHKITGNGFWYKPGIDYNTAKGHWIGSIETSNPFSLYLK